MMPKAFTISFAILLISSASLAYAVTGDCQSLPKFGPSAQFTEEIGTSRIPFPRIDVRQIFRVFLEAVEKGELIIFDERIGKSLIQPEYVEYTYKAGRSLPTVKVYSSLTEPKPFPRMPSMIIKGISAVLDQDGGIVETIVHCGE